MAFLGLPMIGSLTTDIVGFLTTHPSLVHEVMGHALAHSMASCMHRARRGLSRREMRKIRNARRRWFVDNIIWQHKRAHDRNREMIVNDARAKVIARRQIARTPNVELAKPEMKWRDKVSIKKQGETVRGRVDTRRLRARSRWLSVAKTTS